MFDAMTSFFGVKNAVVDKIIYDEEVIVKYSSPSNIKYSDIVQNEALSTIKDIGDC